MSKIKVVGLALVAILAMSAVTAGAASAASRVWVVKGAPLGAGETRTMTAKTVAGKIMGTESQPDHDQMYDYEHHWRRG